MRVSNRSSVTMLSSILFCFVVVVVYASASSSETTTTTTEQGQGPCASGSPDELYAAHPVLCKMMDRVEDNVEGVASEMTEFARKNNLLVGDEWDWDFSTTAATQQQQQQQQLPVVFAHGMGDSCFNSGMVNIGKHTSALLNNVYVTCIPTGDTKTEDTKNGYFLNMDKSVDVFASKIAQDPLLRE